MAAETTGGETTTRSGSSLSGGNSYSKRKRKDSEHETPKQSKPRMSPTPGNDAPANAAGFSYDQFRADLSKELEENRAKISADVTKTVGTLKQSIDNTQRDLNQHKDTVAGRLNAMQASIDNCIQRLEVQPHASAKDSGSKDSGSYASVASAPPGPTPPRGSRSEADLRLYWFARRCARFWKIDGNTESERWNSVQRFIYEQLRMPRSEIDASDLVEVRPTRVARGRPNRGEVIVVFKDVETRDRVTSYARNLDEYVDRNGKPTAGIRHEIPSFLGGVHRALMQYGYSMMQKYGSDRSFKRNKIRGQ